LLPGINGMIGKHLQFDLFGSSTLQLALLLLVTVVACASGAYPALYLSGFKPALVLRNQKSFGVGEVLVRNSLVTLQFAAAITIIVATTIVWLQTRYATGIELGFTKDQIVGLTGSPTAGLTQRWDAVKTELLKHPGIASVSASNLLPLEENVNDMGIRYEGGDKPLVMSYVLTDDDFFTNYQVPVLAGRGFSSEFSADKFSLPTRPQPNTEGNFILNAAAVRQLGWTPETAIGKQFEVFVTNRFSIKGHIVGVVGDSHFESIRFAVKPLVFLRSPNGYLSGAPTFGKAGIRLTGKDVPGTLEFIDSTWKRVIPEIPITRSFLSDNFRALYQNETRLGQLFASFSLLAVFVSCMGLYGLATFNTERRTKEIGVRKVMGSSVWSIVLLLTNDFSKLVLIANVIAWPIAYYAMDRWLQNFAYRIDLTPFVFIGSGLIALSIAWVTVGGTAAKAASQKPVLALRYE
jgi:putative ABC transport system permease protein